MEAQKIEMISPELDSGVEMLYRIDKFMESITDLDRLLEVIIAECRDATDAEAGSLLLYDEASDELYFDIALGETGEENPQKKLKRIRLKMGEGIAGWVAANLQPLNIPDAQKDPRFFRQADKQSGFVTRSILTLPMSQRGKLVGVVQVLNKNGSEPFSKNDETVLSVIAMQAALVIENARLYEENLKQARLAALGQGIAGAAHCIKNILNGIDAGVFLLERGIQRQNYERVSKGWNIMKKNTDLMKNLVLDMLTYSRKREPEYSECDVNEICEAVADLMRDKANEKNTEVSLELAEDIGEVIIDKMGIHRCVLNIVSNAIDACDKEEGLSAVAQAGIVKIGTRKTETDGHFAIDMSDNGCGISEENLKRLFEVFFSTKGSKGTGLGLAVTNKIITEHGGSINVASELGVGTTFTFDLPMNRD